MSTPNDRLIEILEDGVALQNGNDDLTTQEFGDSVNFIELLKANIDDLNPEDEEAHELAEDDEEEDEH